MAGKVFDNKDDSETAGLTGLAAVAPQAAAAAAAIDKAGDLVDGAKDAAKWVGGVVDDVLGGDEHPGESTFPADPNAAPETDAEKDARMARTKEENDKAGAAWDKSVHLWEGRHQDVEHATSGAEAADVRWASRKARAGRVQDGETDVHDGVYDDPRLGSVTEPDPQVAVSDGSAIDVDQLPTAEPLTADVPPGSEVELNPQPIPPGRTAAPLSEGGDASIIIVGGKGVTRAAKTLGPQR